MNVDSRNSSAEPPGTSQPTYSTGPVAIIGIGCRFPGGVDDPASFWRLLWDGVDVITEVPASRYDVNAFYDARPATPGKIMSRWGGFLEQVDQFDAAFFGISPREAERMDPQQRLLLEVAGEALEDAGQPSERLAGSQSGVFVGLWLSDFEARLFRDPHNVDFYMTTGSGRYSAAGRLSYAFGLQGPSVTVDTACSSSLVAVHLACQSLRSGESELALAGGANVILQPHITIAYSQSKMMAPDGRCKFGDARADGYVRSEGAGIVVLKLLSHALADHDPIYAVIRGSAVNNDGRSSGFLTTPGQQGQQALLRKAYQDAGISPGQVQYVEAHGTGTNVGDPVEIQALGAVLATGRPAAQPCSIGSVKTNIGHTEGAAGVAGLIKVALALQHRAIPASLHVQNPNPNIPWSDLPVVLQRERSPWPASIGPAIAGVSAFGITGTNAHVVLEEAPASVSPVGDGPDITAQLLPLSAHTSVALEDRVRSMLRWLRTTPQAQLPALRDICYTASVRRTQHEQRAAFTAHTHVELAERLEACLPGTPDRTAGCSREVVFVFPGQGSQWIGMGRQLLRQENAFRAALEQCECALRPYTDWSLLAYLQADAPSERYEQIDVIQPALFAIEVALAALWRSWGVEPDAVIGHSMGEVAATHVAGALSLDDAARVICRRSQQLKRVSGLGAMAVVGLSREEAQAAIADYESTLSVAVSNSAHSTVISGDPVALERVLLDLRERNLFCRLVKVDVASHSPQMDPLSADLFHILSVEGLHPRPATIPIYSTVTGSCVDGETFDASYWARNLRQPVLFATAMQQLISDGRTVFIELSPHPILLSSIDESLTHLNKRGVSLATLRRGENDQVTMLGSLGALYSLGYTVDWRGIYPSSDRCVRLPCYPWQRQHFWLESGDREASHHTRPPADRSQDLPVLGRRLPALASLPGSHFWETIVDEGPVTLADGKNDPQVRVLPSSTSIRLALAAASEVLGPRSAVLQQLIIHEDVILDGSAMPTLQFILTPADDKAVSFQIFARCTSDEPWLLHASGRLDVQPADMASLPRFSLAEVQARCQQALVDEAFYERLGQNGLDCGLSERSIAQVWLGQSEALGLIKLPETLSEVRMGERISPALIEAGLLFRATLSRWNNSPGASDSCGLIAGLESLRVFGSIGEQAWVYAHLCPNEDAPSLGDVFWLDESGHIVAEALGVRWAPASESLRQRIEQARVGHWFYKLAWQPKQREQSRVSAHPSQPGRWLIFADQTGLGADLTDVLRERGDTCTLVLPGATYTWLSADHVAVNPARSADIQRLLAEILEAGQLPCRGIIHLWSLNDRHTDEQSLAALQETQALNCGSVLSLVQALAQVKWTPPPRLWLVTRAAQHVDTQAGELAPAQASLWGLGRVVAHEHPEIWGGLIDLDPAATEVTGWAPELWQADHEDQIAYRSGKRYVARLIRWHGSSAQHTPLPLRSDGTYLITGGLGGLGLQVAQWLAKQGVRHMVLMGRNGANAQATEMLQGLERSGAHPVVFRGDVSSAEHVERVLADIRRTMPPLRGVIHAAGILDDGTLLRLDWEAFASVLAPKVLGAWNLHAATRDTQLDLFVLFSSVMSLLGMPGQGNYAAANAFLDTLAHYRRLQGLPGLSVNWGFWANVGLAARTDRADRLIQYGFEAFTPGQGLTALDYLLRQDVSQAAVLPMQWVTYARHLPQGAGATFLSELADEMRGRVGRSESTPVMAQDQLLQRLANAAAEARYDMLLEFVRDQAAAVMHFDAGSRLEPQRGFFSSGMDSLMALELRNRLQSGLKRVLPSTLTFDYPNIATLTGFLMSDLFPPVAADASRAQQQPSLPAESDEILAQLEELSEDELRKQLDEELQAIDEGLLP